MSVGFDPSSTRWQLAHRLAGHNTLPADSLRSIFSGAMRGLERRSHRTFSTQLKNRIWSEISPPYLTQLHFTMLNAFCRHVLSIFSENEVEEMLEQHLATGGISGSSFSLRLNLAARMGNHQIKQYVEEQAMEISEHWLNDLCDEFSKEGIKFRIKRQPAAKQ